MNKRELLINISFDLFAFRIIAQSKLYTVCVQYKLATLNDYTQWYCHKFSLDSCRSCDHFCTFRTTVNLLVVHLQRNGIRLSILTNANQDLVFCFFSEIEKSTSHREPQSLQMCKLITRRKKKSIEKWIEFFISIIQHNMMCASIESAHWRWENDGHGHCVYLSHNRCGLRHASHIWKKQKTTENET